SGIANPASFRNTVESFGIQVMDELRLADHEAVRQDRLKKFASNCKLKGCNFIITTEKDFVKISYPLELVIPLLWVEVELQMIGEGEEKWKKLVAAIEEKLDNHSL
ncbi:MAG TPA: tetraacyldisaccharide 4'-kinase, partial [Chlamydiales bacterium]|nr:tetraacyldisaccharide 4'-kinase [Chlamydiales bacterium]